MLTKKIEGHSPDEADAVLAAAYGRRGMTRPVPKYRLYPSMKWPRIPPTTSSTTS